MAANPINQNILKAGPASGVSVHELHPFNKLPPEAAKPARFKEFSRERSKLLVTGPSRTTLWGRRNYLISKDTTTPCLPRRRGFSSPPLPLPCLCITKEPQEIPIPVRRHRATIQNTLAFPSFSPPLIASHFLPLPFPFSRLSRHFSIHATIRSLYSALYFLLSL